MLLPLMTHMNAYRFFNGGMSVQKNLILIKMY